MVVRDAPVSLLGTQTCQKLDLIRVQLQNVSTVSALGPSLRKEDIIAEFADVFDGHLGHLKGSVHLELDESVVPVKLPLRRFPISVRNELKSELDRLDHREFWRR